MKKIILLFAALLYIGLASGYSQNAGEKFAKSIVATDKDVAKKNLVATEKFHNLSEKDLDKLFPKKSSPKEYLNSGGKGILLSEGFETSVPPTDWATFQNGAGTKTWETSTANVNSGANAAKANYENSGGTNEQWLVTSAVTIPAASNAVLSFYLCDDFGSDFGSSLTVKVSETDQTTTADFVDVANYSETDVTNDVFQLFTIDLSAYNNKTVYIAFVMSDDDGDSWYLDDVEVMYPEPYMFSVVNPAGEIVASGSSTDYLVEVSNIGTSNDTYDLSITGNGSWTYALFDATGTTSISTLSVDVGATGNFIARVTVPSSAANGDTDTENFVVSSQGDPSSSENFDITTAAQAPIVPPYTENFDNAGTIPEYWLNDIDDDGDWSFVTSIGHGAAADHTTGSGYFAGVDDSSPNDEGDNLILITPIFDLANSTLAIPIAKFWYMNTDEPGEAQTQLFVEGWNGTDWVQIGLIDYAVAEWTEFSFGLTDFASQSDFQMRFRAVTTADWYSDPSLDDFAITEPPAEEAAITSITYPSSQVIVEDTWPIKIEIANYGSNNLTSLTINWEADNGSGPVAQTPFNWTGDLAFEETEVVEITNGYAFTPGNIEIKAYSSNPNGQTDPNNNNDTASRVYNVITAGQFVEDFEGAEFVPVGWAQTAIAKTWGQSAPDAWYTLNGKSAYIFQQLGDPEEMLITPSLLLDGTINTLNFKAQGGNGSAASGFSTLQVKYSTSESGPWTDIGTSYDLLNGVITDIEIDLSSIPNGDYFFAFAVSSSYDNSPYSSACIIDDIFGPVRSGLSNNDLSVEKIEYPSNFKTAGDIVPFEATIKNVGITTQDAANATFAVNGVDQETVSLSKLHFNESTTVTFNWTATAGVNSFEVYVDADDNVSNDSKLVNDVTPLDRQIAEGFENTWVPEHWEAETGWINWTQTWSPQWEGTKSAACGNSAGFSDVKLISPLLNIGESENLSFYATVGNALPTPTTIQVMYSANKVDWNPIGSLIELTEKMTFYNVDLSTLNGDYYLAFSASGDASGQTWSTWAIVDHVVAPKAHYNATFNFTDGANPLEDVLLSINSIDSLTNSAGTTSVFLPNGEYEYTASKIGYEQFIGTIDLRGDSIFNIDLGLASAPIAINVEPDTNAINIGIQPAITCEFDQLIEAVDLSGITVEEIGVGTLTGIIPEILADGTTVMINTPQLNWSTSYTVNIPSNTVTNTFEANQGAIEWTFTTRDVSTPVAEILYPAANQADVVLPIGNIVCDIDQNVTLVSDLSNVTLVDNDNNPVAITANLVGEDSVSIAHPALEWNTSYTVNIPSNTLTNGYIVNENISWSFTTANSTQPLVETLTPTDGAVDVEMPVTIRCEFDQTVVEKATGTLSMVTLEDGSGNTITGVTASISDTVINVATPSLDYLTSYTVTIPSGTVTDIYGGFDNLDTEWTFTTIANDDATLSDLTVDGTTVNGFSSGIQLYNIELPVGTTVVPTVDGITTDENATYVVNAATALPGATTVVVTAQDGSTELTYTINFTVALNDDATLSDLTVDGTTITGFDPATLTYTYTTTSSTVPAVDAETNDANATYVVNDATSVPGTTTVVVTAEDGSTELTYSINFEPETGTPFHVQDFESYEDFTIDALAPWFTNDVDQSTTYGFQGIDFPGSGSPMACIVFNPDNTTPPMTGDAIQPFEGEKFGAFFASTTPPNNDWLISPQMALGTGSLVKMRVKTYTDQYGLEEYNIGVSDSDLNPESFTLIATNVQADTNWTTVTYDLSAYDDDTVYFGINCISNDRFIFMVDLIEFFSDGGTIITGSGSAPEITNIQLDPANPTVDDDVTVTATITDDGTIASAKLYWGTDAGSVTNEINMSVQSGDTYVTDTDIPAQSIGTTVYYYITATDDDGMSESTSVGDYTVIGIDEAAKANIIELYPNPAKDKVYIEMSKEGRYDINIYSLIGELIYKQEVAESKAEIRVSNFEKGVYHVRIIDLDSRQITIKKLVVQ